MEDEDFLAAVEADNVNAPVEDAVEPQAETSVEAEPETPVEQPQQPAEAPVAEAKPEPGFVPLTVMLDEREKRQRMERELEAMRAQQPKPQPVQIPDVLDDPEGFAAWQQGAAQHAAINVKLDMSEEFARQQHGDELVDKARDWALQQFAANPGFQQQVFGQRHPYSYVVAQYQREQIASQLTTDDFAQFQAWKAAQAQIAPQPTQAAPAAPSPAIPPRSLASAPAAGSPTAEPAQTDEEMVAEAFPRK
jgi:hypothetical protein